MAIPIAMTMAAPASRAAVFTRARGAITKRLPS